MAWPADCNISLENLRQQFETKNTAEDTCSDTTSNSLNYVTNIQKCKKNYKTIKT
jgi:hypothetical protein